MHKMISKDTESETGVCQECGPVETKNGRCKVAYLKHANRNRGYRYVSYKNADGKRFSIKVEERDRLFNEFGNACGICKTTENLKLDHCHETSKFRGLLCNDCNLALGLFKDSTERLERAIVYLS
ncbi:hypothetical protein SEA_ANNADREAMY_222 [Streptomyces phage Annadreamy]|uniref:Endonuclease VII n=2 Tax=Annadreamyvirus annadreamy TaxID=2846392 RepID=A0A345GTS7_9CAUD|nr:endonuclease VII [Streptomyces phage Annadreamy]AXG66349.1 hypothetical protein SEA_ANNADREAMY_222 [Streptomyces phage Annadreamy]QGH79530.1 hypothetical protein SEA_LIMPID_229 [Streptomyces phage Limpid]